jgi:hypothetical protein
LDPARELVHLALGDDEHDTAADESDILPEEDGVPVHICSGGWHEVCRSEHTEVKNKSKMFKDFEQLVGCTKNWG